jgi:hypothetical protein
MSNVLVLRVRPKNLKVLGPVILRIPVQMMHDLGRKERPSQRLCCDDTMLPNIPMPVSFRVVWEKDKPVSALVEKPATFPSRILLSRKGLRKKPHLSVVDFPARHRAC